MKSTCILYWYTWTNIALTVTLFPHKDNVVPSLSELQVFVFILEILLEILLWHFLNIIAIEKGKNDFKMYNDFCLRDEITLEKKNVKRVQNN